MARTARIGVLTAVKVKAYAEAPVTTKTLHDGGGLHLRKRAAGCYWYLRLTDPATNASQWHKMFPDNAQGSYPHKTLAHARQEAARLRDTRSQGVDPRAARLERIAATKAAQDSHRQAQARRLTVRQVFSRWKLTDLAPHNGADGTRRGRKDGGRFVEAQLNRHVFPTIGDVAIDEVSRADLLTILDSVKQRGNLRTANVLLADLKQLFAFAAEREHVKFSVIGAVNKRKVGGADTARSRFLSSIELEALRDQIPKSGLNARTALGVWIILATGVRVGELVGAVWADDLANAPALQAAIDARNEAAQSGGVKLGFVDLDARTWYLPTTKNQRDHTVHLSAHAVDLFARLQELRPKKPDGVTPVPWVFPSTDAASPVCVKSLGKQFADRQRGPEKKPMRNRSKATASLVLQGGRWTAHDLRRTAATLMAQLGFGADTIDECLNHKIAGRATRVYIHDRREADQARAFDALGEKLAGMKCGADLQDAALSLEEV